MSTDHTPTASQIATRVLGIESDALRQLADAPPVDFDAAVALLRDVAGRVIVSGMGKSGHVAAKIAATLSSTGTPAQAVHPGEASHGDLGMITRDDVVLLISNSGETRELADIIAYCARFGIAIVAITKQPRSTLGQQARFILTLPDAPEACAIGMAPTTSTTCALALGDALAVALMQARGFAPEDFRDFHPGGALGAQLLRVADVMHRGAALPQVSPDTPMGEALVEMSAKGFGTVAVTREGRLDGIITDGDLRRNLNGLMERRAGDVATSNPRSVPPETLLVEALGRMTEDKISTMFVVGQSGQLEGLVHIHDALRAGVS